MKTKSSKILAVLLSMVLLLQALPLPSYAEEAEEKVFSSLEDRKGSGKEESTLLVVPGKREANPTEASPGVMETERSASSKENGNVREEKKASSKDLRQKPKKKNRHLPRPKTQRWRIPGQETSKPRPVMPSSSSAGKIPNRSPARNLFCYIAKRGRLLF